MKKVAIIIGSVSDLSQCDLGLRYLNSLGDDVDVEGVYIRSQHRNAIDLQKLLKKLSRFKVDAIITGAGWANHLTGCCDAYLRYELLDTRIVVVGVAFEDTNNTTNTKAALLSVSQVPGTQVVFKNEQGQFVGRNGFLEACKTATKTVLPKIYLPLTKPTIDLQLEEALKKI